MARADRMGTSALLNGEGHNKPVEDSSTACGVITSSATIAISIMSTRKETLRAD